jgi:hypothetical protein
MISGEDREHAASHARLGQQEASTNLKRKLIGTFRVPPRAVPPARRRSDVEAHRRRSVTIGVRENRFNQTVEGQFLSVDWTRAFADLPSDVVPSLAERGCLMSYVVVMVPENRVRPRATMVRPTIAPVVGVSHGQSRLAARV